MTFYDSSQVIDQLVAASKGDREAAAALAAITVPWAAAADYSEMILVQPKQASIDSHGQIRVLNKPPDANVRSQQCAEIYLHSHAGTSCDLIPLPSTFQVQDIKYADGLFAFISNDARFVRGTVAQIREAMSAVRFVQEGVLDSQLEECFVRIPSTIVAPRPTAKTVAANPPFIAEAVGTFTFDEPTQSFIASYPAAQRSIDIRLGSNDRGEAIAMMPIVRSLVTRLDDVDRQARGFAAERLLSLKNAEWLADGEDPVSRDQFVSRLSLESVSFHKSGDLTTWYAAGDLFFGHTVAVYLNAKEEPIRAAIEG